MKKIRYIFIFLTALLLSCKSPAEPGIKYITVQYPQENLPANNKILLVANISPFQAQLEFYAGFTTPQTSAGFSSRSGFIRGQNHRERRQSVSSSSNRALRMDREIASQFNANPPPFTHNLQRQVSPTVQNYAVGQREQFWVEPDMSSNSIQKEAILLAKKEHSYIWVLTENYGNLSSSNNDNKITSAQAVTLAEKFDEIYPRATALLGYEYGGEPGGSGGIDGNKEIHILIYDIEGDYKANQSGGVLGYFWAKDEYPSSPLGKIKSNQKEIFYIDAHFYDIAPKTVYSTLIHEFQHMIHFNQKIIKGGGKNSETWYNEMLSMLAEDVIGPLIGIEYDRTNPNDQQGGHPIYQRIPMFLDRYDSGGVDQWWDDNKEAVPYSIVYAFGAYLIRNYGGPKLISEMLSNNAVNHNSVTLALKSIPGQVSLDFNAALKRYGEALVYSTTHTDTTGSKATFDKSASYTITENSETYTYTAAAFDIWETERFYPNTSGGFVCGPYLYGPVGNAKTFYQPATVWEQYSLALYEIQKEAFGTLYVEMIQPDNADIFVKAYDWP